MKGALYGILVDIGGSVAAGLVLAIGYSLVLAASGASVDEIERALGNPDPLSWLSLLGLVLGFAASFLGGYVCARVAGGREMKWVGVVAAVSAGASLVTGASSLAFEWNAVLALVGMGAVFAGGWAGARRNGRTA